MIRITFEDLHLGQRSSSPSYAVRQLAVEAQLRIVVDDVVVFDVGHFAVVELRDALRLWRSSERRRRFAFTTIEAEENPMLLFTRSWGRWRFSSPWGTSESAPSRASLEEAVDRFIEELGAALERTLKLDRETLLPAN